MKTIKSNSLSSSKRPVSYRLECSPTTKAFMSKAAEELHVTVKRLTDDAIGEFLPTIKKRLEVAAKRTMEMREWITSATAGTADPQLFDIDYIDAILSEEQLMKSLDISEPALWGYRERGLPYWVNDDGAKQYPQDDVRRWLSQHEPDTFPSGEEQHG